MISEAQPNLPTSEVPLPTWSAEDLTNGGGLARITLGESNYVLRITRSSKLILTK